MIELHITIQPLNNKLFYVTTRQTNSSFLKEYYIDATQLVAELKDTENRPDSKIVIRLV